MRSGAAGTVQVVATKWAQREEDLPHINIEMTEVPGGVNITADNPQNLDDVSVDIEVTAPPDIRPTFATGVGSVSYEGRGEGECLFGSGVGSITLKLPADINAEVQLSVGVGSIYVEFPVVGQITQQSVVGTIGTGADGQINASAGVGSISMTSQ
jgi:hypothetical protein